jgi:hypothetical protein
MKYVQGRSTGSEHSRQLGITVELVGGLGNQLFIYATGYELSRKLGCPLYVDTTWFHKRLDRKIGINSFLNDAILTSVNPYKRRAEIQVHKVLPQLSFRSTNMFLESDMGYLPQVSKIPVGSRLRGYFQSWRYFQEYAPEIRWQIRELLRPSAWYQKLRTDFQDQQDWIAVHVRRGDYLNPGTRDVHGILGVGYYKNAVKQVDAQFGKKVPLKIFSDDHAAAQALFEGFGRRIEFVLAPLDSHPIESILLMSQGSGIVTANSSFSWWAAWLGESVTRPVIVPNPWFRSKQVDQDDLFLPNWMPVSVN